MRGTTKKRGRVWYAVFDEGRDPTGKRRQRWISGFKTKADAQEHVNDQLTKLAKGEYIAPSKGSVGEYMREWLAGRTKIRASTAHGYRKNIEAHIIPRIGGIPLQRLTSDDLGAFYAALQAERGLSPRTVRHVHTAIHAALGAAVKKRKVLRNVAGEVELPEVHQRRAIIWTPHDVRAFLEHAREDRLYAMWVLALSSGARRGELCGLTWRSVDLEAGTATIDATLLDIGGALIDGTPKTDRGVRTIPLDAFTTSALRAHQLAQKADALRFGRTEYNSRGLVFVREDGSPIHPAWLTRRWSQIVKASGSPIIRLHDARHTSASLALAAGIPVGVVSERLGHAKTSITLDVYGHVMPAQHRDAADKLAGVMFGVR